MKSFRGLNFQALRGNVAGLYHNERLRPFVIDALDELLNDVLITKPLREAGHEQVLMETFWIVSIDPEDASINLIRTNGTTPSGWTVAAAHDVSGLIPNDGKLPKSDKLVRLAERGVVTVACLVFVRSVDNGVSVLYARHPDLEPGEAAALMHKMIERMLEQRRGIN